MKHALVLLLLLPTSAWAQAPPVADTNAFGTPCPYPETARAAHNEGTTWLSYRGTRDGTIDDVKVIQSSGHTDPDDAAVQCLSHWRFDADDATRPFNLGTHRTSITWLLSEAIPGKGSAGILTGVPHTCGSYYPEAEVKAGIEGTTRLRFTITERGDVRDAVVAQSSGNADLDNSALQCVKTWRYRPAIKEGKPIAVSWQADVAWRAPPPPPASSVASSSGEYASFAYSPQYDQVGVATDEPTQTEAAAKALEICRENTSDYPDSCQSRLWFKDACGAIATASNHAGGFGWGIDSRGWSESQDNATAWAIKNCKDSGGTDCKVRVAVCTPRGGGEGALSSKQLCSAQGGNL